MLTGHYERMKSEELVCMWVKLSVLVGEEGQL